MPYFKFLDSNHVESVLQGSVIFSRLSYFRLMELRERQAWIGDKTDGLTVNPVKKFDSAYETDTKPMRAFLKRNGFTIADPKTRFSVTDSTFIEDVEVYVFSCSWGPFWRLRDAMCSPEQVGSYDAGVQIQNLEVLMDRIWHQGVWHSLNDRAGLPPQQVSNTFDRKTWGLVFNEPYSSENKDYAYEPVSAFTKHTRYWSQREARIVLHPCMDKMPDRIAVSFSNQDNLLVKQFSKALDGAHIKQNHAVNAEELTFQIREIIARLTVHLSPLDVLPIFQRIIEIYWHTRAIRYGKPMIDGMIMMIEHGPKEISERPNLIAVAEQILKLLLSDTRFDKNDPKKEN